MADLPEALRLADLFDNDSASATYFRAAAAELRRLAGIEAERDALLKALNAMLTHMGMDEDEWNKPTFDQARAAIKAVKGGGNG